MKLNEIYAIANQFAPKGLSDAYCAAYGAYDNSGVLVDTGDEIVGIVFSLDLSFAAIDRALQEGANLIITHHPAMYGKINHARCDADDLTERKLVKCLKNGISVISMHLNLDMADGGIDECLALGVSTAAYYTDFILKAQDMLLQGAFGQPLPTEEDVVTGALASVKNAVKMHTVEGGAYGRAYDIPAISLDGLQTEIKEYMSAARVNVYGDLQRTVKRVASFCGAGADEGTVRFAVKQGADVIVSSDFKHHVITNALESGLSVIELTHYASENYGFRKYYEKIRQLVDVSCYFHEDSNLL